MMHPDAQVVVTGMGLATCLGLGMEANWRGVCERRAGMGPLTALECGAAAEDGAVRDGGQAPDLPADFMAGECREVRYLRWALDEAIADAGLSGENAEKWAYAPHRCGVALGTSLHGIRQGGAFFRTGSHQHFDTFLAPAVLRRAARGLPLRGSMLTTCAACSSGLGSIGLALTLLRSGALDVVLAGGYDPVSEYAYAGFSSLRLVAGGPLRPFCKDREGMKIAEGYAVLVLERADAAAARGAEPRAWVRGLGKSSDSHHLTQPHPQGEGALAAIRTALAAAGVDPAQIGLIAAHATGTPSNDAAEHAAISAALGERLRQTPLVALKSRLGHTLGAAGAAELILSAAALREGVVPPTANIAPGDLEFPGMNINCGESHRAPIAATLNLSLGFGGANSCVVLGPGRAAPRGAAPERPPREVLITGVGILLPGIVGVEALAALIGSPPASPRGGPISEEAYAHLVSARRVRRMSDYAKLTLGATALAFAGARIDDIPAFTRNCPAILGTTHGSTRYCEQYYRQIVEEGIAAANPMLFAEGVPNAAAAQLSMMFQLRGFCQTILGSRTSGLDALWLAATRIASGQWDRAVVSAAEEHSELVNAAYSHFGLDRPAPAAGAATFILESRQSAQLRGAAARGRILAGASRTAPDPATPEAIRLAADCLGEIGALPRVLTCAAGTWLERAEAAAVAQRFRRAAPLIRVAPPGWLPECHSVAPLASIAAGLLTHHNPNPAGEPPAPSEFGVLCADYAGQVTALRIGRGGG